MPSTHPQRGPRRSPGVISTEVGFIDILFGLVGTECVHQLASVHRQSIVAQACVALPLLVTALSWIGYHRSRELPRSDFLFISPAFVQFVLDVAIVYAYYRLLLQGSDVHASVDQRVAAMSAGLVAVFVLYFVWDIFDIARMNGPRQMASVRRASMTLIFTEILGGLAVLADRYSMSDDEAVVFLGIVAVALFLYRVTHDSLAWGAPWSWAHVTTASTE